MSKTKKEHNLPSTVYVYEESDGDSTHLIAGRSQRELAAADGAKLVGTYWLVKVHDVQLAVKRRVVKK